MKLIKLQDNYYIISDDEIKEGDYVYRKYENGDSHVGKATPNSDNLKLIKDKRVFKITHSTQQLEYHQVDQKLIDDSIEGWVFDKIKPLDINEIEELIYGYSVEKIINTTNTPKDFDQYTYDKGIEFGFKAAMEINKDKLFTIEDMEKAIDMAWREEYSSEEIIQPLLPKTEWEVEIIDGKIKLI